MQLKRPHRKAAPVRVAMSALGLFAFAATASAAGGYSVESLNAAPTPEYVRDGNSVRIRVTAPSSALVLRTAVKLNGQNVTSALVPDVVAGAMVGTINGLRSGPNLIEVFAS